MVKATKNINPADKARKEARKKELKKNKKQRQQVRSAAIEKRDPEQVISDLEKLDSLEYDTATYQSVSDTLYKDKRKRLKETWTKILEYYSKEDPDKHAKLKQLELDYERKHRKLSAEFEAVRAAQEVKLEDIFLPPEAGSVIDDIADDDPLLQELAFIVAGQGDEIRPPGCPPGLPPDIKLIAESFNSNITMIESLISSAPAYTQQSAQLPAETKLKQTHNQFRDNNRKQKADTARREEISRNKLKGSESQRQAGASTDAPKETATSKGTVIESKPVLFKPKVTKLVPSSVRIKLNKQT